MLQRVAPDQVTVGMYIRKFEGSWFYHPFWRARFVIRTERQLQRIRDSGLHVLIDAAKGADAASSSAEVAAAPVRRRTFAEPSTLMQSAPVRAPRPSPQSRPASTPARVVAPPAFGKADKVRATALAQRSTKVVQALFENCQIGRTVSTEPILSVVDDIATTLEQNGAAFINVTRLRAKGDAIYTHSIAVCALMIGLAREAGCPPATIHAMGTAGLLHDVGKVVIDQALLDKTEALTEAEIADIRRHPQSGHDILSEEIRLPPAALDVCVNHHERLDGSGYPFGLRGDAISQATRMAVICDVYDAMTSGTSYRKGISPAEAIAQMDADEGKYDGALLFKFMRSIGVFPAGKLVRLRSNRLAIILPPAGADRQPLARAFYATVDTAFVDYQDVILSDRLSDDQAVREEDPAAWFGGDWTEMRARIEKGKFSAAPATA
ncbi:HD-GYP domain-containing protein [Sphingomonas sp. BIUV-7]|uniref:HD-GYP domain-containing protein n=1 Tax=Sphingomonas natans TaxID=3063330 RepID=A0ABT8Y3Q7_9SPHN|nr:HD-GYP domain-containing protein [Sphingomonas sp. BIUV-7]MDO6412940.1 HD-GYP domain-containing protein [Sphingomonas sp. BIUV-7]